MLLNARPANLGFVHHSYSDAIASTYAGADLTWATPRWRKTHGQINFTLPACASCRLKSQSAFSLSAKKRPGKGTLASGFTGIQAARVMRRMPHHQNLRGAGADCFLHNCSSEGTVSRVMLRVELNIRTLLLGS